MKISFLEDGWQDYLYWQNQDKKTLKRINQIIKDIQRNPFNVVTITNIEFFCFIKTAIPKGSASQHASPLFIPSKRRSHLPKS